MKQRDRRYNHLANRAAQDEHLSTSEQLELEVLAAETLSGQREGDLWARARSELSQDETREEESLAVEALAARVLAAVRHRRAHLRMVEPDDTAATEHAPQFDPGGARRLSLWQRATPALRPGRLAAAALVVGATAMAVLFWPSPMSTPAPTARQTPAARGGEPALLTALGAPAVCELTRVSGEVWRNDKPATLENAPLVLGEPLRTGQGSACLATSTGIEICVGSDAELEIATLDAGGLSLFVSAGQAVARLTKRPPGEVFELKTQSLTAVAVGTIFAVANGRGGEPDRVSVLEGTVRVVTTTREALVLSDTRIDTAAMRAEPVPRHEASALRRLLGPPSWAQAKDVGRVQTEEATVGAVLIDGFGPWQTPLQLALPAGEHGLRALDAEEETRFNVHGGTTTLLPSTQTAAPRASAPPPREGRKPSPGALLQLARRHMKAGQTQPALSAYRRLLASFPESREAQSVGITVGQLELQSGAAERALSHFSNYLKRGGPLAPEALAGKALALQRLGQSAAAREAKGEYVRRFPNHPFSKRFERELDP